MTSEHSATQVVELPFLNGVPATVLDIGANDATTAARRIAQTDPYLDVRVLNSDLSGGAIDAFIAGLDTAVEECDSLDLPPAPMWSSRRSIKIAASTVF